MPEKPNYLNGMIIKEKVFPNGGKQLKIWVKVNEFVNNNQVNLGNVTLFSTRRYSRQMLHYTGSIDDFELSYKLHLSYLYLLLRLSAQ